MAWLARSKQKTKEAKAPATHHRPAAPATSVSADVDRRAIDIGRELLKAAREYRGSVFSTRFWSDQLMNWTMKDPAFKLQLFRFIDVFPMLKTADLVHDYLIDYLTQPGVTLPPSIGLGLKGAGLAKGIMAKGIAGGITKMAQNFICGVDANSALPTLKKQWTEGVSFSVDLLGEACLSDKEAVEYQRRYLDLVEALPGTVAQWPANPILENDHLGPIPRTNVSIKISSLCARTDPIDFEGSLRVLQESLQPILEAAAKHNVLVHFDMEQFAFKDLTLTLFERCCEAVDFPAGLALQAYLRSGADDAQRIIDWTRRTGRQVAIRLIKGAYWDYESINAERMGWPNPVWTEKRHTDANFEHMADMLVGAIPRKKGEGGITLATGSHNVRSIAYVLALLEKHNLPKSACETQKLAGMADQLRAALSQYGMRIREYGPVGEMIPGMAYFVRRLLENTSNQSWLRAGFSDEVSDDLLLASPHGAPAADLAGDGAPAAGPSIIPTTGPDLARRHALTPVVEGLGDGLPMINESFRDFSQTAQREAFARAVAATKVPPVSKIPNAAEARDAIATAAAAFPAWRDRDPVERSRIIVEAAALMRKRRDEMSAIMTREGGKPWREADADTCEAIDFCEYYAREAVHLFQPERLGQFVGEWNHQWYQPRGVASIISPWNFPLAICCGMTTAALVVGNTAVVKPSTQTRGVARAMCEILWEAGVPARRAPVPARRRPDRRRRDGPRPAGLDDRLHRLEGSGLGHGPRRRRDARQSAVREEGGLRDGRQERDHRRRFGRPGRGRLGRPPIGLRLLRPEMFGLQPGDRAGRRLRPFPRAARRIDPHAGSIGDPALPGTDFGPVIDEGAAAKIREYIEIGKRRASWSWPATCPRAWPRRSASRTSARTSSRASSASTACSTRRFSARCSR